MAGNVQRAASQCNGMHWGERVQRLAARCIEQFPGTSTLPRSDRDWSKR